MKAKIIAIIGFAFLVGNALSAPTVVHKKSRVKSKKAKKGLGITAQYNLIHNSNIDRKKEVLNKDVLVQQISLKGKGKWRPQRKMILINLPSVKLDYSDKLNNRLRSTKLTNATIGIYIPKRGVLATNSLVVGYDKSWALNDEYQQVLNRQYFLDDTLSLKLSAKNGMAVSFGGGIKVADYLSARDLNTTDQDDHLKFKALLAPEFKSGRQFLIKTPLEVSRTLYRERRALNELGAETGVQADTIDLYKGSLQLKLSNAKSMTFTPEVGYRYNKDQENGGRTWDGLLLKAKLESRFASHVFDAEFEIQERDYKSQQIDTLADPISGNPNLTKKLRSKTVTYGGNYSYNFKTPVAFSFKVGFEREEVRSNRITDISKNDKIKMGFTLPL